MPVDLDGTADDFSVSALSSPPISLCLCVSVAISLQDFLAEGRKGELDTQLGRAVGLVNDGATRSFLAISFVCHRGTEAQRPSVPHAGAALHHNMNLLIPFVSQSVAILLPISLCLCVSVAILLQD